MQAVHGASELRSKCAVMFVRVVGVLAVEDDGGVVFFFSSRRRHTRFKCDWSSDVCSSDLSPSCTPSTAIAEEIPGRAAPIVAVEGVQDGECPVRCTLDDGTLPPSAATRKQLVQVAVCIPDGTGSRALEALKVL